MLSCPACRRELPSPLAFCPGCGQPTGLPAPRPQVAPPARPPSAKPAASPAGLHPLLGQRFHDTSPGGLLNPALGRPLESQPPRAVEIGKELPIERRAGVREAAVQSSPPASVATEPSSGLAAQSVVPETEVVVRARVASRWRRIGSWAIDGLVLTLLASLFLGVAASLVHHGGGSRQTGLDWLAETLLAYRRLWLPGFALVSILEIMYEALFTALGGQTPGKRAFGLRVVDRHGACPSPARSTVRAVASLGSGLLALVGLMLALVDRRGQGLHDKLVGTFVVSGS
ncbi:MAG: RDD family protein [Deltaproteobacteria bacterium]